MHLYRKIFPSAREKRIFRTNCTKSYTKCNKFRQIPCFFAQNWQPFTCYTCTLIFFLQFIYFCSQLFLRFSAPLEAVMQERRSHGARLPFLRERPSDRAWSLCNCATRVSRALCLVHCIDLSVFFELHSCGSLRLL